MKYIVFTYQGEGLPVALHLQQEGCEVTVAMVDNHHVSMEDTDESAPDDEKPAWKAQRLRLFENMLPKVPAHEMLEKMKAIPDKENYFVYIEMNHLFWYAEQAKKMGFTGNFPTREEYSLEIDRQKAKDFVAKHYPDLELLPVKKFTSVDEAKAFLSTSNELWVVKGFDPETSVVIPEANDPEIAKKQLYTGMDRQKVLFEKQGFILERFIRNMVEFLPQRIYFNGKLLSVTVNIENKTIGSGGVSYQTGCSGDLVFPIAQGCRMDRIAFPPIVDEMARQHPGLFYWDASLLVDADTDKIYFGEYCADRPHYNAFYTQLAQLPSVHHFFDSAVKGEHPFTPGTVATSIRIFNLNRNADDTDILSEVPVEYFGNPKDYWPMDVYEQDHVQYICGYDPNIAVITGTGPTIRDAVQAMDNNISMLSYPGKYYRPASDFISRGYTSAILNRLDYGLKHQLFTLPDTTIGDILTRSS